MTSLHRSLNCTDYLYIEETDTLEPLDAVDVCLHGVPWDEPCGDCEDEWGDGMETPNTQDGRLL